MEKRAAAIANGSDESGGHINHDVIILLSIFLFLCEVISVAAAAGSSATAVVPMLAAGIPSSKSAAAFPRRHICFSSKPPSPTRANRVPGSSAAVVVPILAGSIPYSKSAAKPQRLKHGSSTDRRFPRSSPPPPPAIANKN